MNKQILQTFVNNLWDQSIVPTLCDYIKIPNKSPLYDAKWLEHGFMDQAVKLLCDWCHAHALPGMSLKVLHEGNRTPVIYIDIPGKKVGTVFLYGHLDKQPEMVGWHPELGPWKPVIKDDKLYGRGGADDGYSIFAAMTALLALQQQDIDHPRCVILIEACEESGSKDLPYYVDQLSKELGEPELIICLDSGAGNYEQLWCTTSLRGVISGELSIEVLTEGVHSGAIGGIAPHPLLILRQLLTRLEDEKTGKILPAELSVDIPVVRVEQAKHTAEILREQVYAEFPFQKDVKPLSEDLQELILNRTWRAAFAITGIEGMPPIANAGNVLLPTLKFKISMRIPPTCNPQVAVNIVKEIFEKDPPFNAKVNFTCHITNIGWNAPESSAQLTQSITQASQDYYGRPAAYMGEGGSIPFMGMLGEKFPRAQFLITGVLGPQSNAHGPNEFLHIPFAKKLTCCVAQVIAECNK
jgi:acetylornithine deacetylase/succinyl-diaminopimelate desuccinylase-like protein